MELICSSDLALYFSLHCRREKKQFEEYKKAMKTLPDKKEREETEALKKQVGEKWQNILYLYFDLSCIFVHCSCYFASKNSHHGKKVDEINFLETYLTDLVCICLYVAKEVSLDMKIGKYFKSVLCAV